MDAEKIDTLLNVANEANIIHFPQGIYIERVPCGSGWSAGFIEREHNKGSALGRGPTPDAAWDNLITKVKGSCERRSLDAQRDADRARQLNESAKSLSSSGEPSHAD